MAEKVVAPHPEGIKGEVFEALHENLCAARPEYVGQDVVLCPVCLREIRKEEILRTGYEHIIPRAVVREDPPDLAMNLSVNQRCGATVLCRQPRPRLDGNGEAKDGCNGLKGSLYDWWLRGLLGNAGIDRENVNNPHNVSVAILVMAYLGAFQTYGYAYILQPELDEVRNQFDFPKDRKTAWLDKAFVNTSPQAPQNVMTTGGNAFGFFGQMVDHAPLGVRFRKFVAWLPNGVWPNNTIGAQHVKTLLSLLPRLPDEPER